MPSVLTPWCGSRHPRTREGWRLFRLQLLTVRAINTRLKRPSGAPVGISYNGRVVTARLQTSMIGVINGIGKTSVHR